MISLLIDGTEVQAQPGWTILQAAEAHGLKIPNLCHHQSLVPFGGCRLCLVEVKGRRGFPPACCTIVEEGMDVSTQTPPLKTMRKEILELILSEHPHACLICTEKSNCDDKKSTIRKVAEVTGCVLCSNNGRCDLQDVVTAIGVDRVRFPAVYREIEVHKADPFFDRNYNLCILCGRCVRTCREVRGASTIDFVFRGSQAVIGTAFGKTLAQSGCQFCGACVDVCPTGALVDRAARPDELPDKKVPTICALCSNGCVLSVEVKGDRVMATRPSEDGPANQGQACVKGRFLVRELALRDRRILKPHIRKEHGLEEATWEEALDEASRKLRASAGASAALITSPQLSVEDLFVLYRFGRQVLRTDSIGGAADLSAQAAYEKLSNEAGVPPALDFSPRHIGRAQVIVVCGEDLAVSNPMVWLEVHRAVRSGAVLITLETARPAGARHAAVNLTLNPGWYASVLDQLSKFVLEAVERPGPAKAKGFEAFRAALAKLPPLSYEASGVGENALGDAARILGQKKPAVFLFGSSLITASAGPADLSALWNLAALVGGRLIPLGQECNLRGELEVLKSLGDRRASSEQILAGIRQGRIKVLYQAGSLPAVDRSTLDVVIVQDSFWSENAQQADVVFPAAAFYEVDGMFVSHEGRVQPFGKVLEPAEEAKPDWRIVSELAQRLGAKDFDFGDIGQVRAQAGRAIHSLPDIARPAAEGLFLKTEPAKAKPVFLPVRDRAIEPDGQDSYPFRLAVVYGLDSYRSFVLSHEVKGLKRIRDASWVWIHPCDAESLGLAEADKVVLESTSGQAVATAHIAEAVGRGTLRAVWSLDSGEGFHAYDLLGGWEKALARPGVIPVRVRKG